jgi:hypothetical protein
LKQLLQCHTKAIRQTFSDTQKGSNCWFDGNSTRLHK